MSLFKTIQSHIHDFRGQLYTSIPAVVKAFDPEDGTVDVQLSINKRDDEGVEYEYPLLERIPVQFPMVKDCAITFPITEGDKVIVHFCQTNIENFFTQNKDDFKDKVSPRTDRYHNINDAFVTLGVRGYDDTPVKRQDKFDIYYKDTRITISDDGLLEIEVLNDESGVDSNIDIKPDGEISITNNKESSSITMKADGNIAGVTKDTFSMRNSNIELITLLSDLIDTLANNTVNSIYGTSPMNSKPELLSLKNQLDTMKE